MIDRYFIHGDGLVVIAFIIIFWIVLALAMLLPQSESNQSNPQIIRGAFLASGAAILIAGSVILFGIWIVG